MKPIPKEAFKGSTKLVEFTIENEIKAIGPGAFSFCFNLRSVCINEESQLKWIGDESFRMSGLTIISLPQSLKHIGKDAFKSCGQLRTVIINDDSKLESINKGAFSDCHKLSCLIIPKYKNIVIYGLNFDFSSGYPEKELISYLVNGTIGKALKECLINKEQVKKKRDNWQKYTQKMIEENKEFKEKGLKIGRRVDSRRKFFSGKAPSSSSAKGRSHSWYNGRK